MSALPDINILISRGGVSTSDVSKSGSSKSTDIFHSILDSLNGKDSSWVSSMYSDINSKSPLNSKLKSNLSNIVKDSALSSKHSPLSKSLKNNSHEDLLVPAPLQNQLVMFLEKQGFSLNEINQVLSASKDSSGLIRLDKLLAGLSDISPADNTEGNKQGIRLVATFKDSFSTFLNEQGIEPKNFGTFFSSLRNKNAVLAGNITDLLSGNQKDNFIETSRIPGVQEILFKMGLGVGEVKKIIEQSKNGNGEIELDRLSSGLNKFLSGAVSESDLASFFSENNIPVSKRIFNTADSKSVAGNLLTDNSEYLTDEAQQKLKENIEAMLKEKDIREEKIKSVLGKLDKVFTEKTQIKDTTTEANYLCNQKILSILEGEKQIISRVLGDSTKYDIAAFLKNRGASDRDIKSFLDSFNLDIKKAGIGDENNLKSFMLNEKAFLLSKYDQSLSTADQGSLKLNLSEILKLAQEKTKTDQLAKSTEGTSNNLKHGPAGKEKSGFSVREIQQITSLNINQEKEIKHIGKVSQTNTATSLPGPLPRIVDKMMIMIRTGEYKSRLHITPPELGKLDIDLTVKNGHLHANLSTENALVKEIIEANLNQLKQQLNNQGLTVDRFDVMVGHDNGTPGDSNSWAEGRNEKDFERNSVSKSDITGEVLISSPLNRGLIGDNQIDVHV